MKHVIVIETAEHLSYSKNAQLYLTETIERYTDKHVGFCVLRASFNVIDAVAAVQALFGGVA